MLRKILLCVALVFFLSHAATAEQPDSRGIVASVIEAAGGDQFSEIGILKFEVSEEETRNDGTSSTRTYVLFVDSSNLGNARMEMPGDVVLACRETDCWATRSGVVDTAPQTPSMARKTLNQTIFPLLLPYSLRMDGVYVSPDVGETTWDGREAWTLSLPFSKGFFVSPFMTSTWEVIVAKDDSSLLAAHFVPPVEFQKMQPEGMRYRSLKTEMIEDAEIPAQVLTDGIDLGGHENGHVRVTKIESSVYGPSEPTLFMVPTTR